MRVPSGVHSGNLFDSFTIQSHLDEQLARMNLEIDQINPERLLNTSPCDLTKYFVDKYKVEPPALNRPGWTQTESEAQVDVRWDQRRWIEDRNRPCYVPGQRIEIEVPIEGDPQLLYARASEFTLTVPKAGIKGSSVVLTFEIANDCPSPDLRQNIDQQLEQIDRLLGWLKNDIDRFNLSLTSTAENLVTARRERILANKGRAAALGIPIKIREDAPKTYAVPEIRRKIAPEMPAATTTPYAPEPILAPSMYEEIITMLQSMTRVMECSPSTFETMKEEDIRQLFLVTLNAQFTGAATGETFNVNGKTDILIRDSGRNIFIAECKFWKGPKAFKEAIDQLLGYTSWRDTKTAILVFNRDTSMSTVLSGIKSEAPTHPNYKRTVDWKHESGYRYIFRHNTDPNRELVLTVLVFDIPRVSETTSH